MPPNAMLSVLKEKTILITGGHGFIGSHLAKQLHQRKLGNCVRIVDLASKPNFFEGEEIAHETIIGDLHDPFIRASALHGVEVVLHFAANMGGMGTIHSANNFKIYSDNHTMTLDLVRDCLAANVQRFFYASSACVYPGHLQEDTSSPSVDSTLREDSAFATASPESLPRPQGLYGLEKLNTELLLNQFSGTSDGGMQIQIARFHNVYGPGGAYKNGREKAPAALLRKAIALTLLEPGSPKTLEIWGDGSQRRSFLYIDDAINAILRLLENGHRFALNIGSEESVSIRELSHIALKVVGLNPHEVRFVYREERPVGVASRNSNNDRVREVLGWGPTKSTQEGMQLTSDWMLKEIRRELRATLESREAFLQQLTVSKLVDMASDTTSFAILLPITSRGSNPPSECLRNLETFAKSLIETTWKDIVVSQRLPAHGRCYRVVVYLAIDHDDHFLHARNESQNKAEAVLRRLGLDVKSLICNQPKGHICALWRDCARRAWDDGCEYFVLFGDDVQILDEGWMSKVDTEFHTLHVKNKVPLGIGCIAFTDVSFPGMPTFPIIHRRHMDTFNGKVIPDIFINQDGDPFLFQLYRRWNCSKMIEFRVTNAIGGSVQARYEKKRAQDWTFKTLEDAIQRVSTTLDKTASQTLTVDIVIPCYRVELAILSTILSLKPPRNLSVMFIIIIDDPTSPNIAHLERMFSHRVDVRIRVNTTNVGASASRNRGMTKESAAEWVYFLDDDIVPSPDLLVEVEKVIRANPEAAGFVGNCQFPCATTIFQSAVHLAGVTYFWDIATKIGSDVPWGVTANLIARRNVKDGVVFDLRYPKTGGGEDIDFCRLKREESLKRGGRGFEPAPSVIVTHPWWKEGKRSYWRFYMWSYGDGALVTRFPELSYRDYAPNSAELIVLCLVIPVVLLPFFPLKGASLILFTLEAIMSVLVVNILHDLYRHIWSHPERDAAIVSKIKSGPLYWAALVESTIIRIFSEAGRLRGVVDRREWGAIGRRFDWFAGRLGDGPMNEERMNNVERLLIIILFVVLFHL